MIRIIQKEKVMKLTVVELFAGVGGFRVGLNHVSEFDSETGLAIEQGDWNFVWANQWEPSTKVQPAFNCYTTRFGVGNHSNQDINTVDKNTIPDHTLLVGGFPCQDYSVARTLSKEKGIEGKKGVLFWDIKDVIEKKQPSFVLLENVDRLLKSPANQRGRDFAIMLKTFDELGYHVHWRVINAADYGMPQKRRRVFILAYKRNTTYANTIQHKIQKIGVEEWFYQHEFFNSIFPVQKLSKNLVQKDIQQYKDIVEVSDSYNQGKFLLSGYMADGEIYNSDVESIVEEVYPLKKIMNIAKKHEKQPYSSYTISHDKVEKWKYLKGGKKIERVRPDGGIYYYSEGSMNFPDDVNVPGRTMLTSEGTANRSSHIVLDEESQNYRTITEVEAELLQMFPPNWTNTGMTKRKRYFMMGNALVTGVISRLEPHLKEIILHEGE